ncbi:DUF6965 family protein [Emticicia fontis]
MNEYKYILEPYKGYKTRYTCPNCSKDKVFARYIDKETGEHLNNSVGRCNRESSCTYHYTPKQYFLDNHISNDSPNKYNQQKKNLPPQQKVISFISFEVFNESLKNCESNEFVKFLINLFGIEITNELISKYFIGTSKLWNGATVFWQIDKDYNIRTGKIMLYNPFTGKRVKEPINHINWVHTTLKLANFELKQCLFGEHLMIDKSKPVAIVESEKTAIIASVYLPQFIWLAAGSLTNLSIEKCKVLSGFNIFLFPDLNGFEKWENKAKELLSITNCNVSDLLEINATDEDKREGYDLADYLIQFDYKQFIESNEVNSNNQSNVQEIIQLPIHEEVKLMVKQPLDWSDKVNELENYFNSIVLLEYPIKLNQAETANNVSNFIDSHLTILKNNNGRKVFLPHLERLRKIKNYLITKTVSNAINWTL